MLFKKDMKKRNSKIPFRIIKIIFSLVILPSIVFSINGCVSDDALEPAEEIKEQLTDGDFQGVAEGTEIDNSIGTSEKPDSEVFEKYFLDIGLGKISSDGKFPEDIQQNVYIFSSNEQICLYGNITKEATISTAIFSLETNDFIIGKQEIPQPLKKGGFASCGRLNIPDGRYEYKVYIEDILVAVLPFEIVVGFSGDVKKSTEEDTGDIENSCVENKSRGEESSGLDGDLKIYPTTPTDELGMENKKETEHYIFYFNETEENFVNKYIEIAEKGYNGLEIIFGKNSQKIKIYLCETVDEFRETSSGMAPPGFDGSEAAGQCIGDTVAIYKPEEFKPGPGDLDEEISYKIGLLHEIGHAMYHRLYPKAYKKNEWLDEALADKSITGGEVYKESIKCPELVKFINDGSFIRLSNLEKNGKRDKQSEEGINFIEYISLVNFIALEFGFDKLRVMLSEYNSGNDLVNSIEMATGLDADIFEERWIEKINNW